MPTTKKGKLHINVQQVDRTEWIHILWPVKFCPKAGAILFFLMCKLSQGNKISSDHQSNIVVSSTSGNIILDDWIKTCDGWVAKVKFLWKNITKWEQSATAPCKKNINNLLVELRHPSNFIACATAKALGIQVIGVKFLWEMQDKRVQSASASCKKNINDLHLELRHPSKSITHATTKALGVKVTGTFKPHEDYALDRANQWAVSKNAVTFRKFYFFDISSPSTPTFESKQHWLHIIVNSSNLIWNFFLKKKSNLADAMIGSIKNLKNKYNLQV